MEDFKKIDWDLVYGLEVSCRFSQNTMTRHRREGKKIWGFIRKDQTTMEESKGTDSDNLSILAEVSSGFGVFRKKNPLSKEEKPSLVAKENGLKMVNTVFSLCANRLLSAEALLGITLPRFSGDLLPKSDVGIILAMANRLNSLVGLFAAGCQPNSTNDPFGLRRISYGLVHQFVTWRLEQYLVDDAAFETNEEKALQEAFLSVKNKVHPGIEIDDFIEISADLVQPICDG
ncbi:Glycine-tRNA ligase, beta subunit, partial [Corchorus capsularis]